MSDKVNHPSHYTDYPLEVIEIIKILLTEAYGEQGFEAYCFGNELKYRLRTGLKNEDIYEEIGKANKYKEFRQESESEDDEDEISLEDCYKPWEHRIVWRGTLNDLNLEEQEPRVNFHWDCDVVKDKIRNYFANRTSEEIEQDLIDSGYYGYAPRPDELDRKGIPEHKRHLYK